MMRIGFGYDVHQLVEGRELWLGGIKLEHSKGLLGHSDADVLIHALCDALLGAANMRDIGYHFPDTSSSPRKSTEKTMPLKFLSSSAAAITIQEVLPIVTLKKCGCTANPKNVPLATGISEETLP